MCGIVGAIGKLDGGILTKLFLSTETRGKDASGFWFPSTGIVKDGKKVSEFLPSNLDTFNKGVSTDNIFMAHCRAATHGKPEDNVNNHPLESDNWIMVHNGTVRVEEVEGYSYKSETDSEGILAFIEKYGIVDGLAKLSAADSAALILVKKDETDSLYLWRNGSPMTIAFLTTKDLLLAVSTDQILASGIYEKNSTGKLKKLFGSLLADKVSSKDLPQRELWKITKAGEEFKAKKIATTPYNATIYCGDWRNKKFVGKAISYSNDNTFVWKPWNGVGGTYDFYPYGQEYGTEAFSTKCTAVQKRSPAKDKPVVTSPTTTVKKPTFGIGSYVELVLSSGDLYDKDLITITKGDQQNIKNYYPLAKVKYIRYLGTRVKYGIITDFGMEAEVSPALLEVYEKDTPICYGYYPTTVGVKNVVDVCEQCEFAYFCVADSEHIARDVETVVGEVARYIDGVP